MKKFFASLIAVCMVLSLTLCLSSCDWFTEEASTTIKILETPEATDFLALLNNGIAGINTDNPELTYNSSVSVGGVEAKRPEGNTSDYDLGVLDSAADYVKNLILQDKPFNVDSVTVPAGTALVNGITVGEKTFSETDVYFTEIAAADFFAITDNEENARNWATENETDAEGNTITNAEGDVMTVSYLADNNLLINIRFNDVIEEKDEEGNITSSTAVAPDAATIEKYFGKPTAAASITSEMNKTSDYLLFSDYTYEYSDCSISAVIDITTGDITSVSFSKAMNITIPVKGEGTFADIGDAELVMRTTETSSFTVNRTPAQEADGDTVTTAAQIDETTVTSESDTTVDVTDEITSDETTVEETTAVQEETTVAV